MMMRRLSCACLLILIGIPFPHGATAQQLTVQDVDQILERADKLLEEAKAAYEDAQAKSSVQTFIEAGFKLEEARIKFLVLQEIGSPEKQKTAADRLRAVNQLSKLIHDSKVAISGTPAEPATPKPSEPQPPANPVPNAAPVAPKAAVDVSKRAAVPDPDKQREAEKLVKNLFKEQYAKKAPADRKVLAGQLLAQAAKSQDDTAGLWVLYREAQEVATQACDPKTIVDAIEGSARYFDIDALSAKYTALTSASKVAKTAEDFVALTEAILRLIDDLVMTDQFEAADKAVNAALQHSKKSNDTALIARTSIRTKEVTEAKLLYQSMKSVMESLAKNPDDPNSNLEIGRFLCFVKGNWDLGLRFIAKSKDATLKALAEKEMAVPLQVADRISLADSWFDLGNKEKSPLRKSQMFAHSRLLYESALSEATGLVRANIEKRLLEFGTGPASKAAIRGGPVDLISKANPKGDDTVGAWTVGGGSLSGGAAAPRPRIAFDVAPVPEEYDLSFKAESKEGVGEFAVGIVGGGNQVCYHFDALAGTESNLANVDGGSPEAVKGRNFQNGKPRTVLFRVRKDSLTILLDGKEFFTWKADWKRVSVWPGQVIKAKDKIFLVLIAGTWKFSAATMSPIR